ncbi:hypothetical protein AAGG74_15710 [Bacillus mexicanus]|uniref:hypothetical protein n=1 Tax=Bacillus mexicanus TaxID=2834415 RepID=UPI003D1CF6DF
MVKLIDLDAEIIAVKQCPALYEIFNYLKYRGLGILERDCEIEDYKKNLSYISKSLKENKIGKALDKIFLKDNRILIVANRQKFIYTSQISADKVRGYNEFVDVCSELEFIHTSGLFFFNPFYGLDNHNNEDEHLIACQSMEMDIKVLFMRKEEIEWFANSIFVKFMVLESEMINKHIKEIVAKHTVENNDSWHWPYG